MLPVEVTPKGGRLTLAPTSAGFLNVNHGPTVVLLTNGNVLIAGGDIGDGDGSSVIAELYDPATGAFSRSGNMTARREQHTATLLSDGRVLVAGGRDDGAITGTSAELYDPTSGTFSTTGSMAVGRDGDTATLLPSGESS